MDWGAGPRICPPPACRPERRLFSRSAGQTGGKGVISRWKSSDRLPHPVEVLLQDLPVLQAFDFFHRHRVDGGLFGVLRRFFDLIEDAKVTRERGVREFVGGAFIGDIMAGRDSVE